MKLNNEKGFTLFECLIVLAIIGILALVAIPNYEAFREKTDAPIIILKGELFDERWETLNYVENNQDLVRKEMEEVLISVAERVRTEMDPSDENERIIREKNSNLINLINSGGEWNVDKLLEIYLAKNQGKPPIEVTEEEIGDNIESDNKDDDNEEDYMELDDSARMNDGWQRIAIPCGYYITSISRDADSNISLLLSPKSGDGNQIISNWDIGIANTEIIEDCPESAEFSKLK